MKTKPSENSPQTSPYSSPAREIACASALALMALLPVQSPAAIDIQYDYSYDSSGFFSGSNVSRRTVLEAAALFFEERINDTFSAIAPSGGNTWSLQFEDPSSGSMVDMKDPILPANTIVVYVGARDLPGDQLGFASYGYSWWGYADWAKLFNSRDNETNFDSFGGSLAFDSSTPWYFDPDITTMEDFKGQQDFYTVALHELGHLLGFGSTAFSANRVNDQFVGPHVISLYGEATPLDPGSSHFQEGLHYQGRETAMDPTQISNTRKIFTELDFAVLKDIGYHIEDAEPIPFRMTTIRRNGSQVTLSWSGGRGPFQAQIRGSEGTWRDIGPSTTGNMITFTSAEEMAFFRIAEK